VRRRGVRRFVLEVLFLAGVAVAVTIAELSTAGVIGFMALAWVVVALLEWTAWLDEPHYGRGLPPRYYVPQVALPPPRAIEQGGLAYPVAPPRPPARPPVRPAVAAPETDDETTFERPAADWSAAMSAAAAAWPVLDSAAEDETMIAIPDEVEAGAPSAIVPLPPVVELEETIEHRVAFEDEAAVVERAPDPAPERARPAAPPRPERPRAPLPAPVRLDLVTTHRLDPLVATGRRRLLVFRGGGEEVTIEVPDGPPAERAIPATIVEQARAARG
jgi:hypothetical protein